MPRLVDAHWLAVHFDSAALRAVCAVKQARQLRAAGTQQTCEPYDFALVGVECGGLNSAAAPHPGRRKYWRTRTVDFAVCLVRDSGEVVERAPNHCGYKCVSGEFCHRILTYEAAVS